MYINVFPCLKIWRPKRLWNRVIFRWLQIMQVSNFFEEIHLIWTIHWYTCKLINTNLIKSLYFLQTFIFHPWLILKERSFYKVAVRYWIRGISGEGQIWVPFFFQTSHDTLIDSFDISQTVICVDKSFNFRNVTLWSLFQMHSILNWINARWRYILFKAMKSVGYLKLATHNI